MDEPRLNLQNPVNWKHPLNVGRLAWWNFLKPSGMWGGSAYGRDLCKKHNLTFTAAGQDPQWTSTIRGNPALRFPGTGGGLGWYATADSSTATLGAITNNFTFGCTFKTDTVAPIDINGLAGLMGTYHIALDNSWWCRQHDAKLQMGGNSSIESGNVLDTTSVFRIICVVNGGVSSIYLNGDTTAIVSGSGPTYSASASPARIGVDFLVGARYFIGWINDAFVSARPWNGGDVALDWKLSQRGYVEKFSPLNFMPPARMYAGSGASVVSFTTQFGAGPQMQFANPGDFTTSLYASGTAGGIGPIDPEGPAEFETTIDVLPIFGGGEPTLVGYETTIDVDYTAALGNPAEFTTSVGVGHRLTTIPNGNRRIVSQRRYRR